MQKPFAVILYYCFAAVDDVIALQRQQMELCVSLGLLGRIIVASEGINGTLSGTVKECEAYMAILHNDNRFASTDFKIDYGYGHAFQKINVRIKNEIVHADLHSVKPYEQTSTHLTPAQFKALKDQPDVVLLDVRSNYEHNLGKFKGAQTLDIDNFREFKDKLPELEHLKSKKVITYCTGGIKCEKASAYLLGNGFENVYQLLGGIIRYGIEEQGEDFDGKCYVFDKRIAIDVNTVNPTMVATCKICSNHTNHMVNCANPACNKHVTICPDCLLELKGACSPDCLNHPEKRDYNPLGYFARTPNVYDPTNALRNLSAISAPIY